MLPVPIKAEDHETQGLMGSDDDDDVSISLNNTNANGTNIPINNTTSSPEEINLSQANGRTVPKNRISRRDVNKRIESYLRESDENCRESATLVAIVIIGLVVTGSVIGFLQLGHHDTASIHKGAHARNTHFDGEELPNLSGWFDNKIAKTDIEIENGTIDLEETLGIQPLYRNYLLQTIYEYSFKSAIRVDKNDPIFQHVSMTYGGPWTVPSAPSNNRRVLQNDDDGDTNGPEDENIESDTDTEKIVWDEESNIEMISLENGRNDHTFSFRGDSYTNNINDWHCYIFEFANADQLVTKKEFWKDYTFKISVSISNFAMESGYDFVRIYINSQYNNENILTGNIESKILIYRVDFNYLNEWNENDIPSFELCANIQTDSSIILEKGGFDITTKIEYENPQIVTWTEDECFTSQPTWRNPSRWDGSCGIGIKKKKITKCDQNKLENLKVEKISLETENDDNDIASEYDESGLFRGVCEINEEQITYCNKKDCGSADINLENKEIKNNPKLKYHFNGHGRIDPTYPNPFKIYRSTNMEINIDNMIFELNKQKSNIASKYLGNIEILTQSVQSHTKMDDSKLRLGIKLARSLILGDTFHISFTGSSNTAGHDNLFMSTYPMQLQSIMRPLWKLIGYKGASFIVSDDAIGGAIGSDQMTWCIPAISGGSAEKIDVIFWESTMNDAGSDMSRKHTIENHIRNSLTMTGGTYNQNMPNRPLWHSIIAGSNGNNPTEFIKDKNKNPKPIYSGYADLIEIYSDYGAGIIEFFPSLGMNPMKKKDSKNWSDEHFYVTWHPGPVGHRIYAEIIAYFYLDSVLYVLNDILKTIKDLEKDLNLQINKPVLEMLDLLQDAPYQNGLPNKNSKKSKCKPICSDAINSYCLIGFNPKDEVYEIKNYVTNKNGWKYDSIAGNPQPLNDMNGGQASIDTKFGYKGNKNSGQLVLSIIIKGNNYLLIEKPYADWGGLNEIIKNMPKWFTATIIDVYDIIIHENDNDKKRDEIIQKQKGKILKCETKNKQIWNKDILGFGCLLTFEYSGKYKIGFNVDTKDDIPICVIATF